MTGALADVLPLSKSDLVTATETGTSLLRQVEPVVLDAEVALPVAAHRVTSVEIETFLVTPDGAVAPTGEDERLVELFRGAAEAMAAAVFDALGDQRPEAATYLTASLTPPELIVTQGHFDDGQYLPDEGVGMFSILGSGAGPRLATGVVECGTAPRPGTLFEVTDEQDHALRSGELPHHDAPGGQIVVLPMFGQLHSGPPRAADELTEPRSLMVLRTPTRALRAGGAAAPRRRLRRG